MSISDSQFKAKLEAIQLEFTNDLKTTSSLAFENHLTFQTVKQIGIRCLGKELYEKREVKAKLLVLSKFKQLKLQNYSLRKISAIVHMNFHNFWSLVKNENKVLEQAKVLNLTIPPEINVKEKDISNNEVVIIENLEELPKLSFSGTPESNTTNLIKSEEESQIAPGTKVISNNNESHQVSLCLNGVKITYNTQLSTEDSIANVLKGLIQVS